MPVPTLMPHQQQAFDFLTRQPFGAAWLGIGYGKTLTTLMALQHVQPQGHTLVVAPVAIARSTWLDEIETWNMPVRTKSLIVDEHDRPLSKDQRLEAFSQIHSDPPTVYFINQEMITQSSNREQVIIPTGRTGAPGTVSDIARAVLATAQHVGPLGTEALVEAFRADPASAAFGKKGRPPAKTHTRAAIKELLRAELLVRTTIDCRSCHGKGCQNCRYGLVDQMPWTKVVGANGKKRDVIVWPFPTVIIDEAQAFKSHSSSRFQALAAVRPAISRLIELTGTPTPNGLDDLWAQMYLLDQGKALGPNITAFRERWFTPKMVYGTNTPAKWIPKPGAEAEIHQAIAHLVLSAENVSNSVQEPIVNDVTVVLPQPLLEKYKALRKNLVLDIVDEIAFREAGNDFDHWLQTSADPEAQQLRAELAALTGDAYADAYEQAREAGLERFLKVPSAQLIKTVVAQNPAVLTSKLQQFASGTLYTADPDDPTTAGDYEIIHDEKIQMVEYIVRNNGNKPVLLTYHFQSDKEQIYKSLKASGIDVEVFDGSRDAVRRWNAKQIPVLMLHPASAGHGLNLQHGGSTMIWYTLPFSLEHYMQANGRLARTGQTEQVIIHRLIAKGTQDEKMPGVLQDKADTQDRLMLAVRADRINEDVILAELDDEVLSEISDDWALTRL